MDRHYLDDFSAENRADAERDYYLHFHNKWLQDNLLHANRSSGRRDRDLRRQLARLQIKYAREITLAHKILSGNQFELKDLKKLDAEDERKRYYYLHISCASKLRKEINRITNSLHARIYLRDMDYLYRLSKIFYGHRQALERVQEMTEKYPE